MENEAIQPDLVERVASEDVVLDVARHVLNKVEAARVHHVQPANGSYDYFYVSLLGHNIVFKLPWHDDNGWYGGEYGPEIAALSGKAAECATAINDLLFTIAKDAATAATAATRPDLNTVKLREALEKVKRRLTSLSAAAVMEKRPLLETTLDSWVDEIDAILASTAPPSPEQSHDNVGGLSQ